MSAMGYQVRLSDANIGLKIGASLYWDKRFRGLLHELNRVPAVGEALFPDSDLVDDGKDGSAVRYVVTNDSGKEILRRSRSLKTTAIPRRCLVKLQAAIDQMHAWAEDPKVSQDLRDFCQQFRLPDPKNDPDAYRLTGGMFSRHLHVLWGYEKQGTTAFLPSSEISSKWDDAESRKDVAEMCRGSFLKGVFRLRNIVLVLSLAAAVYMGFFFPARCAVHGCEVGRGVLNLVDIEAKCPRRCALPGCSRHLDGNGKCDAHKCPKCGRQKPTSVEQKGECDDCFWKNLK